MSWFSIFSNSKDNESDLTANLLAGHEKGETSDNVAESMRGKTFTHRELSSATKKFSNLIGEGSSGCVYKGKLKSGNLVAVKLLNEKNLKFNVDALMFSHPNLVTVIDYCTYEDQRFLVSEYMPLGNLQNHLFDLKPNQKPIDWGTRLKIALGVARGLQYLHCQTNPPFIYRNMNLTPTVIALMNVIVPMALSDYAMTGRWTLKSDIYSFGVVLLELITGRKAFDITRKDEEIHLVSWSRHFFKDRKKMIHLLDPLLQGRAPVRWVRSMIAIASMCLEEHPCSRPLITDIVVGLDYLCHYGI